MLDNCSLLSWMNNPEPQPQFLLHLHQDLQPSLLEQISEGRQSPNHQPLSLLTRMDSLVSPEGLGLNLTQRSTGMFSSIAMPSSKHIARGRSPRHQFMSRSSLNLPEHLVMTEQELTQPSDRSSQPSRATTLRLKQ